MPPIYRLPWWMWLTPSVLVAMIVVGAAYAWLFYGPGRALAPHWPRPRPRQAVAFYGGLVALYAALGGPLGVLAMGYLFTAHMLQHILAALVVPLLIIAGLPPAVWQSLARHRIWGRGFRLLVHPLVAVIVFNIVFGAMVWPPVITLMVRSMAAMIALHLLLVAVGIPMWWPLVSPIRELPPLHPGLQILYIFGDGLPMLLPLALVTLDTKPLYGAVYGHAPMPWGFTLVSDQQLGGALCILLVHFLYLGFFLAAFRRWVRREEANRVDRALLIRPVRPSR
jgi:putative membrane protein